MPAASPPERAFGAPARSWAHIVAVICKQFLQLQRDRLTFAMLIVVPIMQLLLFGYAINADPRQLPTAVVAHDNGPLVRSGIQAAAASGHFLIEHVVGETEAEALPAAGRVQFLPGLIGEILTMTLVMMTSMAMTRERERGTLENLLATPVQPLETMASKILRYVIIGYAQVLIVLGAAGLLFDVPMQGRSVDLLLAVGLFIVATLTVGFSFSTIARSQMQSMQMTMFFFLPNLLLSGFMFPFHGMPPWAQVLGEWLPLTHFLRIVRGIMLKGAGWPALWPEAMAIAAFVVLMAAVAMKRYRQTLD